MTDGHKKALELIAENKRTRSPFLDLGNLGLTEVPEEVFECVWLEFLSFGTYAIDNIESIKYEALIAQIYRPLPRHYNRIIYLYPDGHRQDSQVERIGFRINRNDNCNSIKIIPIEIEKLFCLNVLVLDSNKINSFEFIKHLPNRLKYIDLSKNNIRAIPYGMYNQKYILKWRRGDFSVGYEDKKNPPLNLKKYKVVVSIGDKDIFVNIKDNPLISPPKEIIKKGSNALNFYYNSTHKILTAKYKENLPPFNQIKTLLDGDTQEGNQSLLNQILQAFRNLELHDTQAINPLWLTNAVCRIINSKIVAVKKGHLFLYDLGAILNDPTYAHEGFKYPRNKFLYIVKIMQEFELCYRIAEEVFIVPDLLTVEEQPVPSFDYDTALRFVLQYDFLPASVLPRFMVQLHTRIVEGEQWRTGTALEDPIFKSKAVVKADRDEKRLYLWVNGPDRDSRRNFFNFIRKTLHDIHDSFEKLTVTELVPLPGYQNEFVEYKDLAGNEDMGIDQFPVGRLRAKFSTNELLSGIESSERRQPRRHAPVKVFVSYSHKDADYKDELVTALAYLARMEEIELWQDGRIEAGMEWRKEIFEKLAEAEIVICLVSSNFIASDFCYSVELKQALEAHDKGEKIVVPIEVKTCGWKQIPEFGRLQGVPAKPISSYSPHDDGWGEVFKGVEGAVKRVREKSAFRNG